MPHFNNLVALVKAAKFATLCLRRGIDMNEQANSAISNAASNADKATLTKADIVEKVYNKIGFSKKEALELVELVFDSLKDVLVAGDKVKISGFGNFDIKEKKSRVGRNPQTGDQITISARRVLTFKPSQVLKNILNEKG